MTHLKGIDKKTCIHCQMASVLHLQNEHWMLVDVFGMKVSGSLTRQQQLNIDNQSNDSTVFMPLSSGKFCFNLNCTQHWQNQLDTN